MSRPIIEVRNISKVYQLGTIGAASLKDEVGRLWARARGNGESLKKSDYWALRDVSFEVQPGEVLGIIGRNGAGKSTLLKILSRITQQTAGEITLRGRVASLLEVGTGFHPDLSGRENVYLNGAILGMRKDEIARKFDEIVAFADIEKFIDTPVKRYSSGMYVRLAFAVAAHLEPEILIVDEVLAVGDYEFQRRCLGKMNEVTHSGRTVLFVSHNMTVIEELCPQSILLKNGRVEQFGPSHKVVARYLTSSAPTSPLCQIDEHTEREGTGSARITRLELLAADSDSPLNELTFRQSFRLRMHYHAERRLTDPRFGFALLSDKGDRVFQTETTEVKFKILAIEQGDGWFDCLIWEPNLLPGLFYIEAWIVEKVNIAFADHIYQVGRIEISVDPEQQEQMAYLTYPGRGRVFMECLWSRASNLQSAALLGN